MLRSTLTIVFSTCTLLAPVLAQAPTDAAVEQALATWQQTRKRSLDGQPDPAAAAALGDLAVERLTGEQLEKLCGAMLPQTADAALKQRCRSRLQQLAEAATADGAVAAARLVELVDHVPRQAPAAEQAAAAKQRVAALRGAAQHAGFGAAVAAGRATSLYLQVYFLRDPKAAADAGLVAAMLPHVGKDWPPARVRDLLAFAEVAMDPDGGLDGAGKEALRVTCLAVLDRALANDRLEARERRYLEHRGDDLRGAAARGQLLGQPAPAIEFLWSNTAPAPKSFADFRGKVVVVDFWATWCVPCVAAFPHLAELAARYRDLPVVFVGVTSLQGYVAYPKAAAGQPRRVDTKEPQAELARLGPWCEAMQVTWTAVVSKQDCFNPDFGVRSIPHLAILDAEGRVRWNGLSPEGQAVEDHVDELLVAMDKKPPVRPAAHREK